ncbi:PAS domain S-box-containing protein/diguanylate cyclase (GGDEF) domain-containing protein [Formivibrio citricus]|uniref:PAS domain S-box-containing protein/diguanylate cyclase (GGDEF) domain-containing protein n=1 Tax=Formivibrio citricus TaxID=83765 RepID=A0A1I5A3H0_9NEIS|nr:diguanylate cyclase [Formivibrio citricus]SFN56938.1 PAS domain S-box-containing protein/diguanylate cyclase (GGDEF) domain-containing protein [Formivibrio citricus]
MHSPRQHNPFFVQWLIFVAAVLILGASTGYEIWRDRVRVERHEQERLLAMSRVVQINVEKNLESTNEALAELRKDVVSGHVGPDLNDRLRLLVEAMPGVRTLTILDASGRIWAASRPELLGRSEDFSQREYFRVPQQHADPDTLYVSPPFRTVLGAYSLVVTRMIPGPHGEFGGIVAATLAPTYFNPLLDSVNHLPDMFASLQHGDGVVFLAVPSFSRDVVGMNLAQPGSLFLRHRESGQPVTVFSGMALAREESLMLVQRDIRPAVLKMDKPLVVAVSRPLSEIYRDWNRNARMTVGIFFLATMLFAAGLYVCQRHSRQFLQREEHAARRLADSEQRLKTIVDTEPECVKVLTLDGVLEQMNRAGLALMEADSEEQVTGAKAVDLVVPECRAAFSEAVLRAGRGESAVVAYEVVGFKGAHRWLEMYAVPMRDVDGGIVAVLGVSRDITARKKAEARLQLAASVFLHAREGIAITDLDGTILDVNETFTTITGYSREEAIGKNPRILKSGLHDAEFYADMWRALIEGGYWAGEIWNRRKNGEIYAELNTITAVFDEAGVRQHYVVLFADITEIKQYQLRLEHLAHFDVLTGLPNRMLLADRLRHAIAEGQRNGKTVAVVYLDLDGFKEVNDRYGHEAGDKLLIAIAQRFTGALRAVDTVARLGGDEFVAVLADQDSPQSCLPALERLLQAAAEPVTLEDAVLHVSGSAGVACYPQDGDEADVLMRHADQAMYQAKQMGKNRFCMFSGGQDGF